MIRLPPRVPVDKIRENIRKKIEAENKAREEQKEYKSILYSLWLNTEKTIDEWLDIKEKHAPTSPDLPWDDMFCKALETIPILEEYSKYFWNEYLSVDEEPAHIIKPHVIQEIKVEAKEEKIETMNDDQSGLEYLKEFLL